MMKNFLWGLLCLLTFSMTSLTFVSCGSDDDKPKQEKTEKGFGELTLDNKSYDVPYGYVLESDKYFRLMFSSLTQTTKLTTKTRWTYCDIVVDNDEGTLKIGQYQAQADVVIEKTVGETQTSPLVMRVHGILTVSKSVDSYVFDFVDNNDIRVITNTTGSPAPDDISLHYKGKLLEWDW